jgi:ABC-type branched-subunit amino acid transport system ATPase component
VSGGRALLDVRGVSKAFGGLRALTDVSFSVPRGSIKAVIGPNGAGKTTLLNVIARLYEADAGEVWLEDRRIDRLPPHRIVRLGVARTFQNLRLFADMTVLENVMVGRYPRTRAGLAGALLRTPAQRAEERAIGERAWALLADVGLADHAHELAGGLPFGKQRLLEIARALATDPVLLLLDEPAAGLNAEEAAALGAFIRRIRLGGVTTLLVEHHMDLVMEISDEILVLNFGQALAEGPPERIRTHPDVIQAYLGDEAALAHDLRA